ncbi:MAG: 16S rRNA (guanine(527)-N(7))-methyltransferase RsmG [Clostridia bacterium]|nr:16S rRNA (guanine(527)-N(7))-methyltransferase RsmG [Clostridia bacterium]
MRKVMDKKIFLDLNLESIQGEKKEKFDCFSALLKEYNTRYNLTSITEDKEILYKHFLDSSAAAALFQKNANVAEVGSGAGFPSIVLKILREDLCFTLMESVGKKCEFLRVAVDKLGFKGMNICNIRAEDAAREKEYRERFDYCVARAVARMNSLSEYCLPLVKVGGTFIAYKSADETEIQEAESAYRTLGGRLDFVYGYSLPEGYGERVLAGVKKIKTTSPKYPRGQGKERKNPL